MLAVMQVQHSRVSATAHRQNSANAAAVSLSVPVEQLSDSERQQVANQYGYTKIGKKLPEGVTLSQIVKSMPSEVTLTLNYGAGLLCLKACAVSWLSKLC